MEHERLSVVLPFVNQQRELTHRVESMLYDLTELAREVQLVLVDDGSTDATPEIIDDLRCKYPQVTSVRLRKRIGASKAVEFALSEAGGDFIFLHESYEPLDIAALTQLWALRHDREIVVARASTRRKRVDVPLLDKLASWGKSLETHWKREAKSLEDKPLQKGLQMMRREAVEQIARVDAEQRNLEVSHLSQRRLVRQNASASR